MTISKIPLYNIIDFAVKIYVIKNVIIIVVKRNKDLLLNI